jgi:uncharacterized membrane protein YdjX (TVP38/TMEM64 family)
MRIPGAKTRLAISAALIGGLFLAAAHSVPHSPQELRAAVAEYGQWGPLVFVALWTALTPTLFSGTLLAATGGLLFGPVLGSPLAIAGATLGGVLSFTLARLCGGSDASGLGGVRIARAVERIEAKPFGSIVLLRLLPGVPATLLNYAAGLTRIRWPVFAAAIAVGGAPRTIAYVALGGSLGDLGSPLSVIALGALAAMGLAGLLFALGTRRRARLAA